MTQSQKSDRVHSVSRSGCEVQSHHRGLMKTSNFRREIRKTYYRNDPVKYDLNLAYDRAIVKGVGSIFPFTDFIFHI